MPEASRPRLQRIGLEEVRAIARGAAVLGTGGGGDPHIGALMASAAIRAHGPVELTALEDLPDDAVVLPVAMMGAPTVMVEKIPSGDQVGRAVQTLTEHLGLRVTHVACIEAGGVNSLVPVAAAAELGLPLVDGDGMGRAFPELQQVLLTLCGVRATPMAVVDEKGNRAVLDTVDNHWAERLARSITIDMGCSAMISNYAMDGAAARHGLVPGTLSLAASTGALLEPGAGGDDPAAAVAAHLGGSVVVRGKVVDVERRTTTGFARGTAVLEGSGPHAGRTLTIEFQNENLMLRDAGRVLSTAPDLICCLDAATGAAITTESLRFGHRVSVVVAPCDPRWTTPEGLALAGPSAFGYSDDAVLLEGVPA